MPLTTKSITIGAFVIVILAIVIIAKHQIQQPSTDSQNAAFFHSIEGTYVRIGEVRDMLKDAHQKSDLHTIHDQMYYLEGLFDALEEKLSPEERKHMRPTLKAMRTSTDQVDRHAGMNNLALTTESLDVLFSNWKQLDQSFRSRLQTAP